MFMTSKEFTIYQIQIAYKFFWHKTINIAMISLLTLIMCQPYIKEMYHNNS